MRPIRRLVLGASVAVLTASGCATPAPAQTTAAPSVDGREIYSRDCLACHMSDGRGVPGMNPALVGSPWVAGPADALAGFVMTGGYGPDVLMARFDYLSDAELAALLTYIRAEFAGIAEPVIAAQVARMRSQLQ
ncbi:MAG TPA: cytochrome c [Gammaproteobacteria bacterium]|nr:cytochrome c [Gammaproteobacteria bacterium]